MANHLIDRIGPPGTSASSSRESSSYPFASSFAFGETRRTTPSSSARSSRYSRTWLTDWESDGGVGLTGTGFTVPPGYDTHGRRVT